MALHTALRSLFEMLSNPGVSFMFNWAIVAARTAFVIGDSVSLGRTKSIGLTSDLGMIVACLGPI